MNTQIIDIQNRTSLDRTGQPPGGAELGRNEFLQLLMAQLSNQNPMDPTDDKQFIAQLSQFASLEQLQNLGDSMNDLLRITSASNSANAVSLLGKEVRISGNAFKGSEGVLHYELPQTANELLLEVRDKNNRVVRTIPDAPKIKGANSYVVQDLPDGEYKYFVVAKDGAGKEINATMSVIEIVEGANFTQSIPILMTRSGREVSAADVLEIRNVKAEVQAENEDAPSEVPGSEPEIGAPAVLDTLATLIGMR